MKKIVYFAALLGLGLATVSCNLDKFPETGYSEHNASGSGESDTAITTREALQGQLTAMYNAARDDQNFWYQFIITAESRADNAYGCPAEGKTMAIESNTIDSDNEFPSRIWDGALNAVNKANQIICNIDIVKQKDPSLTDTEYKEWLSEALCWRAHNWMIMMDCFGEIPMQLVIPPAINSGNIEEVYPLYFPKRVSQQTVGEQIVKDIEEYAVKNAPSVDASNKFKITKGFANGLLARFYAMKPFRDWAKVKQYCEAVEGLNYQLCNKYGDLWAYTPGDAGMANQNLQESIFELSWPNQTSGSWMWMMFHRNAYKPSDSFDWAKWCTPSRSIARAYDALNDVDRKGASIIYEKCSWTYQYDKDNFAFMHKFPTNVTPIYVMRLADILLLHAEALANSNDPGGAADIVDRIRTRAQVTTKVSAAERGSAETMKAVVLNERRLELAFEGFRWFDLKRYGDDYSKLKEICDGVNAKGSASYDSYFKVRNAMDDNHVLLPVPTTVLANNTNIEQNLGY